MTCFSNQILLLGSGSDRVPGRQKAVAALIIAELPLARGEGCDGVGDLGDRLEHEQPAQAPAQRRHAIQAVALGALQGAVEPDASWRRRRGEAEPRIRIWRRGIAKHVVRTLRNSAQAPPAALDL